MASSSKPHKQQVGSKTDEKPQTEKKAAVKVEKDDGLKKVEEKKVEEKPIV